MPDFSIKEYTEGLSVLFVEDDPVGSALIDKILEPLFSVRYAALNGLEGLQKLREHKPSLIVTDLMMPVMDGITMLREIRKEDQKTPVVLMTASLEHLHLVEAINLGVSKFLAKPLERDAVHRAILSVARELSLERMSREARRKEVELLRYRDRYHSRQEELARSKEQHIARNMLEDCFVPLPDGGGWLVDQVHQPKDVMSGDSSSIRLVDDNKLLFFLADAMGHGLSASVTSMLATSFFNHSVDGCSCSPLPFADLVQHTARYAARNLLEDEVFSFVILQLSLEEQTIRVASCGMPPMLLVKNGTVEKVRGNNPPLTAFTGEVCIQELPLEGVAEILLATDGLSDAPMMAGQSYSHRLARDLADSASAQEMFELFRSVCNPDDDDDDVTLIRIMKAETAVAPASRQFSCHGTLGDVSKLQRQVREYLDALGAVGDELERLDLAMGEALLNAFEHGCLRMGSNKRQLLLSGEYDDLVMSAAPRPDEEIVVSVGVTQRQDRLQVWIEIADPGEGVQDQQALSEENRLTMPCGRGMALVRRSVDIVRRSLKGNRLLLMQMTKKEEAI